MPTKVHQLGKVNKVRRLIQMSANDLKRGKVKDRQLTRHVGARREVSASRVCGLLDKLDRTGRLTPSCKKLGQ